MALGEQERKKLGLKKEPRVKCDLRNEEKLSSHTTVLEKVRFVKWEIKKT